MALRYIVKYGHPALRMKARQIETISASIRELAEDMIETMEVAEGIGLAAPQIAESKTLLVINAGLIEEDAPAKVYINPVILAEAGSISMEEGCLSIPDIREDVIRPEMIKIKYLDLEGGQHEEECNGMLARVLQHEVDHLQGLLFVDRISQIKRKLLSKKLKAIAAQSKEETAQP
ncbi:peptide deformylase [candidate division KSB1 bacterium]|nr:peptide deformylase [candidate division KSB1 bacterium]